MNTVVFVALVALAEMAVVWGAYTMGFQNGWLNGWDQGRGKQ